MVLGGKGGWDLLCAVQPRPLRTPQCPFFLAMSRQPCYFKVPSKKGVAQLRLRFFLDGKESTPPCPGLNRATRGTACLSFLICQSRVLLVSSWCKQRHANTARNKDSTPACWLPATSPAPGEFCILVPRLIVAEHTLWACYSQDEAPEKAKDSTERPTQRPRATHSRNHEAGSPSLQGRKRQQEPTLRWTWGGWRTTSCGPLWRSGGKRG